MNSLEVIIILCLIGLITLAVDHLTVDDDYLSWEEYIEKLKEEREDENKRTKKNDK